MRKRGAPSTQGSLTIPSATSWAAKSSYVVRTAVGRMKKANSNRRAKVAFTKRRATATRARGGVPNRGFFAHFGRRAGRGGSGAAGDRTFLVTFGRPVSHD